MLRTQLIAFLTAALLLSASAALAKPQIAFQKYRDKTEGAFDMLIPQGWKVEGGIYRETNPNAGAANMIVAKFNFRTFRPDDMAEIRFYPETWFYTQGPGTIYQFPDGHNYNGMIVKARFSASDFLEKLLVPFYRNSIGPVRVTDRKPLPGITKIYQQEAIYIPGMMAMEHEAALITVIYKLKGKEIRERFFTVVRYIKMADPQDVIWSNMLTISARAPEGEYDALDPVFTTCIRSTQPDPQWVLKEIQGQAKRGQIVVDTMRECNRIQEEMNANRRKTNDYIIREFGKVLRGEEEYSLPGSDEKVTLPNDYKNVWADGQGRYILTDDANFEPGRTLNGNWQQMQVAPQEK
ncbi:MAG TPA: hypothetical protein PL033_02355 [Candidatus Brocadiia bacterium]|nr:hypothetical protein [Candidatus Brocadiia bacterium]